MSNQDSTLRTIVFVDYESWFYGLHNQFNAETDVTGWFKNLKTKGLIDDIYIFGDFENNKMIAQDRLKLRTLTSNIIDCANLESRKDYTDFIILDRIYQTVIRNDLIQQYIIFSGDGHFSNVAAFLKNFKDKIVGVYAVSGTLSTQLKNSASWVETISPAETKEEITFENCQIDIVGEKDESYYENLILDYIRENEVSPTFIPTFTNTVSNVSANNNLSREIIANTLKKLIEEDIVSQRLQKTYCGKVLKGLSLNKHVSI
ncbi:MAG TPA: NYN domain-containing protein [Ruminiclostridium sp.]|nr:NYN domain-containing protein [Ruminiclostridium sp.]